MFFLIKNSGNLLKVFYLIIFRANFIHQTFKESHATNNSRAPQLTLVKHIYSRFRQTASIDNRRLPSDHRICKTSIIAYRKSMTINKFMQDSNQIDINSKNNKCPKMGF